jgi:hypothetical protein
MTLRNRALMASLALAGALGGLAVGVAAGRRDPASLLLLVALVGLALVLLFQQLQFDTLCVWIVATGLAYPLLNIEATNSPLSFDRIVIAGLASWLVLRPTGRPWSRSARWLGAALVCLVVSYGIRAAFTDTYGNFVVLPGNARHYALNTWFDAIVAPVALYFVVGQFAYTRARCRRLALAMAVAGALLGAIGVAEEIFGFELASLSGGTLRVDASIDVVRNSGPYGVPETYALVLLVCLALTLWWTLDVGRRAWGWGVAAMALEVSGLAVTLFRAALLAAVLIFVAGLGLRPGRALRLITITIAIGLAVAFSVSQLTSANPVLQARVSNTENISGRFATYQQSLKIFTLEPLTGVGIGQFETAQNHVPVTIVGDVRAVTSPHSTFLGLLAEQGVVGLIPLLAAVAAAWALLRELRRRGREPSDIRLWACLVGASLAYLVMSGTLTMLPYGPSNAFFAIALGMAAARTNVLADPDEETLSP